ncbi:MAG: class I tRNA ligase family protein, partial [bacterium]|nr:class I tRNA ligase family protein [bacterium]
KITAYAEKLLAGLETVDYIERAKVQQVNWIGRSEGATITFTLRGIPGQADGKHTVSVFTTRPDTLFGATFLVVSPELAKKWIDVGWQAGSAVRAYVASALNGREQDRLDATKEKTGVDAGIRAVNPENDEEVPVWIADYVLGQYGTGAIMAVPAHDERDFAFAKKYGLPMTPVIASRNEAISVELEAAYTGDGILVNSGKFTGMDSESAKRVITEAVGGKMTVTYKLRDWVFSRQRYWGEPIPVVFCPNCVKDDGTQNAERRTQNIDGVPYAIVPIPEDQLPVLLPDVEKYQPTETGDSPLAAMTEWVNTTCPTCRGPAKRETDVMPNWAGSSWYFLRYCDPHNDRGLADPEKLKYWMPIDWYNGGMEHTTLHLLYSRFWNIFLHDIGVVPVAEPYAKRTSHGLILASDGEKMSKSRGNVVNPDEIVEKFGADAVRVYEMFIGPFDQPVPWSTDGLVGCRRFLDKVASFAERVDSKPIDPAQCVIENTPVGRMVHRTIKKVTEDIEAMHFNTAVSALMEAANTLAKEDRIPFMVEVTFLTLLAPFAPHLAEELHAGLPDPQATAHRLADHPWPTYDSMLVVEEEIDLVIQVNGKLRATIRVPADMSEADARARALVESNVAKYLEGKQPQRMIFVPGRLLNIVI